MRALFGRRDQRGQASMGEMMVTVLLLGIVMTFVYKAIDTTQYALAGETARLANLDEARTLMAVTTKDLRTATRLVPGTSPFVAASDNDVTFYANLNNTTGGPRKIRIYVDSTNQLIAQAWTPDVSSVSPNYTYTGAASPRYVGRFVANPAGQPIFTYYGVPDATTGIAPVLPSGTLSAANLLAVYSVKVTLVVRKQTTLPVRPVTLVNQVRLPNVDYQPPSG
jgi:hypothetical protein